MGRFISVSGNKNKLQTYSQLLKDGLKTGGKKVFVISQDWAEKKTISPYVASMYDADKRYDLQAVITDKLAHYDYVIIEGYTAQTLINNMIGFKTNDAKKSFCVWLDSLESVTYGIRRPDTAILVSDNTHSSAQQLVTLFPNDFELCSQQKLAETAKNMRNVAASDAPHEATMLQLVELLAQGKHNVKVTSETTSKTSDAKLKDLIEKQQTLARSASITTFWQLATTPLQTKVHINAKPQPYHVKALEKLFSDTRQSYGTDSDDIHIAIEPKNEVQLAENIAWQYDTTATELNYQQRTSCIETWAMHLNQAAAHTIKLSAQAKLSWADVYLLLSALPTAVASIQQPTSRYGYIDTEACPSELSNRIEELFDTATQYSLTESTTNYILMGHITNVRLELYTKDIVYLLKNSVAGSELLQKTIKEMLDQITEKLPIFTTTITQI